MSAFFHEKDQAALESAKALFEGNPGVSPILGLFDAISARIQQLERLHAHHASLFEDIAEKNDVFRQSLLNSQHEWTEYIQRLPQVESVRERLIENFTEMKLENDQYLQKTRAEVLELNNEASLAIKARFKGLESDVCAIANALEEVISANHGQKSEALSKAEKLKLEFRAELLNFLDQERKHFASQLASLRGETDKFRRQVELDLDHRGSDDSIKAQVRDLEAKYVKVKSTLDSLIAMAKQREEFARGEVDELRAKAKIELTSEMERDRKKVYEELDALKLENERFQAQTRLDLKEAVERATQAQLRNLDAEYAKIKDSLESAAVQSKKREEYFRELTESLTLSCSELKANLTIASKPFHDALSKFESEIHGLKVDSEESRKKAEDLRRDNEILRQKFHAEIQASRAARAVMEAELKATRKNLSDERAEIARLGDLLSANELALAQSRTQLAKLRTE